MRAPDFPALTVAAMAAGGAAATAFLLDAQPPVLLLCAALGAAAGGARIRPSDRDHAAPPPQQGDEGEPIRVEAMIDAFDDPVLVIERQMVVRANAAAERLLGSHVVGDDVRLAIRHPAAADSLIGPLPQRADPQRPIELVGLGERERRWQLVVRSAGPTTRLVRLVDVTGAHAAERMRVDFVANASHELKTPLATLLGFIETLDDPDVAADQPTVRRFVKIMMGEAKRMQRLIEDLISLSRIEAEKFRPPQTAVLLPEVVEEVRRAVAGGEGEDRILVAVIDETPPVAGDPAQLSQLLHNLIGNALKYGRKGTPVRVAQAPAPGGMVQLSVQDEGDGIAAEHLPRLTERFYRIDAGRSRALGGTGLGLAIVKHIVERHRGRLEIDSVVGQGTTVRVLLPAPQPAAAGEAQRSAV